MEHSKRGKLGYVTSPAFLEILDPIRVITCSSTLRSRQTFYHELSAPPATTHLQRAFTSPRADYKAYPRALSPAAMRAARRAFKRSAQAEPQMTAATPTARRGCCAIARATLHLGPVTTSTWINEFCRRAAARSKAVWGQGEMRRERAAL